MLSNQEEYVILGVTTAGQVFDVPEWAERLCGMLSSQRADSRVLYSDYLQPVRIDGLPAVVMQSCLQQDDPQSYAVVKQFVVENQLKTRSGRLRQGGGETGPHPVLQQERRQYIRG